MFRIALIAAGGILVAGCNTVQQPDVRSVSTGPRVTMQPQQAQPTQAQVFARDEWLACLKARRSAANPSRRAADAAFAACRRQEEALAARLAEDPTMTPERVRAGLEQVKANWRTGARG